MSANGHVDVDRELRAAPIEILGHDERANQGSREITVWCPTCEERVVALRSGACGWCDTPLADEPDVDGALAELATTSAQPARRARPSLPAPATAAARLPREPEAIARWRREEIVAWIAERGTATIADIKDHFGLSQAVARADVDRLRIEARISRTGRDVVGPRGGRPSAEFRVGAVDAPTTSHAHEGSDEATQQADDSPAGTAAADDRTGDDQGTIDKDAAADGREVAAPASDFATSHEAPEPEPARGGVIELVADPAADRLTVHQQLTVRYVAALIGWIERSSIMRDQGPPEHVFDRIERLLEITEGVR